VRLYIAAYDSLFDFSYKIINIDLVLTFPLSRLGYLSHLAALFPL